MSDLKTKIIARLNKIDTTIDYWTYKNGSKFMYGINNPADDMRGSKLWNEVSWSRHDHTGWYTCDDGMDGNTFQGMLLYVGNGKQRRLLIGYYDKDSNCFIGDMADIVKIDKSETTAAEYYYDSDIIWSNIDTKGYLLQADSCAENAAERSRYFYRMWEYAYQVTELKTEISESIDILFSELPERNACNHTKQAKVYRDYLRKQIKDIRSLQSKAKDLIEDNDLTDEMIADAA